ncbi:MAG: Asp-tRNA(Asn)/Glu-tRNA(Gln) amidotransferase subunit GatC [Congregibacter sp.]
MPRFPAFFTDILLCTIAMPIDGDSIRDIAQLARLRVEDDELADLTPRFNAVLDLFEQLQAVPTDGVEPMANPLDASQRLREDQVTESNQRDALQSVAPAVQDGLYLVPRVVE